MKTKYIILIILFLMGCHTVPHKKFEINDSDLIGFSKTDIAIKFDGHENRYAIIPIIIQEITLKLMFDSGSEWGTITLTPDAIKKIKINLTGNKIKHKDAYGNVYYAREFTIPEVNIGNLYITNIIASENLTSPRGFDGYIGLGFLKNFNIMIDYQNKKITLYRNNIIPNFINSEKWFRYSYYKNQQFNVSFKFLKGKYRIGLDSGSGNTLIPLSSKLGKDIVSQLGIKKESVVINKRNDKKVYIYHIDNVYLDEYDLGKQQCILSDDMDSYMGNGLLGFDFFNNNKIFICFDSNDIWLKRIE